MTTEFDVIVGAHRTTASRYSASTESPLARVVLAHGAGAGQRHPFIVNVARRLAESHIDVVTFDFPYMAQRRRVPDPPATLEDCFRQVIAMARESRPRIDALFAGGKSLGGRIATHLAAAGEPLKGVFALGYPLHPPGKPHQLRLAHLPAIEIPMLVVQGERDPFGTPAELAPVLDTMQAPVTLDVVAGGDHSLGTRGVPPAHTYASVGARVANWIRMILESDR
ncbi:MAG: alpha/beta fold hydrolase [Acidobacteria bacterium]|nr:alpha/beta fold hydrolase [Acidobacteriota bacterium]